MLNVTRMPIKIPPYTQALVEARKLKKNTSDNYTIALGGNCLMRFLESGIDLAFLNEGTAVNFYECGFDSWMVDCIKPPQKIDAWIIWLSAAGYSSGGIHRNLIDIDAVTGAITVALNRGERVIVILPETIECGLDGFSEFARWNKLIRNMVSDKMPEGVLLLDPDQFAIRHRNTKWYASSYWTMAKSPLHPDATTVLGYSAAQILLRCRRDLVKLVIVDLDNTLWGGTVGDLGPENISLDPSGDGHCFLQLQSMLKDLLAQGIVLAVSSKNNLNDAKEPFLIREEMILSLDDFVGFHANWENKSSAIKKIVNQLGIGMDTVCFIDDSPHEREEAMMMIPDLIVPDLPENPEDRPAALLATGLFLKPITNNDDTNRTSYYKNEAARDESRKSALTWEDYLSGLAMELKIRAVNKGNLQRVSSLINKTNQFNLTTKRYSSSDISRMMIDDQWITYCYELTDKFGSAGIIGVLFAKIKEEEIDLDSWILSCRVINRQVELAIFEHFISIAKSCDSQRVTATFIKTQKNTVIEGLLPNLGFSLVETSGNQSRFELIALESKSHFINILQSQE